MADERDDGGEPGRALATQAAPKIELARSLAGRKPGQAIVLDKRGDLVTPGRLRRWRLANAALTAAVVAAGGMLWGPPALIGGAVGVMIGVVIRNARYGRLRRAFALMSARRDDEARVLLREIVARGARRNVMLTAERLLAVCAFRAGEHQAALEHIERARGLLRERERRTLFARMLTLLEVVVLLEVDVDRAAAKLRELDGLPATEYFTNERRYLKLAMAFHRDRPDELPDDLELHDWARAALDDNDGGGRLALLAWAFDRRGDTEMTELLLRAVESHMPIPLARLQPSVPKLYAWVAPRIAALAPEDD
ncbi:MAG TPA: hypothetical protein VHE35_28830 [Kofleriaceae bacterium]|nr:hypothetical protein [Kofleriaceae bacterium]